MAQQRARAPRAGRSSADPGRASAPASRARRLRLTDPGRRRSPRTPSAPRCRAGPAPRGFAHAPSTDPDRRPARRPRERRPGRLAPSSATTGDLELDVHVPAGSLGSVNELELVPQRGAPDGCRCAAAGLPPVEVDLDTRRRPRRPPPAPAGRTGFQLCPQVLQGSLPGRDPHRGRAAVRRRDQRSRPDRRHAAAGRGRPARRPARAEPDAFLADDRSGLIVGATTADSTSLEAPLKLSSTRLLDQRRLDLRGHLAGAVRRAGVDRRRRPLVLMLGSWAPGNEAAPPALAHKLVDDRGHGTGWAGARRRPR